MIRISHKYSISRKNGYFQTHEHTANECIRATKTYPSLLSLYAALKSLGESGDKIVAACQTLLETSSAVRVKKVLSVNE